MNRKMLVRSGDVVLIALIAYFAWGKYQNRAPSVQPSEFEANVDLQPLRNLAIQDVGRIKSFDSFARGRMRTIAGPYDVDGHEPVYAYLDLMLDPAKYQNKDIIYVKRAIRPDLARAMEESNIDPNDIKNFVKSGLMAPGMYWLQPMQNQLNKLEQDVIRTQKFVNMINWAMGTADAHRLSSNFAIIPSPTGNDKTPWLTGEQLWGMGFMQDGHDHGQANMGVPGLDPKLGAELTADWNKLVETWRAQDAAGATAAIASLANNLKLVNPELYPDVSKLNLESWYFKMKAFVWVWVVYALAAIPLIMFIAYRMNGALKLGIGMLVIAFGLHTLALGMRWYISGRIPNANMFEAVLASVWFGVLGSFVLEYLVRKTNMKGLFYFGSAICAMIAMMCQQFMPTVLRSDIDNVMPVLDDIWLYIHTNMIIWSYALIGIAAIIALLYLRYRLGGGDPSAARIGGAGSLILDGSTPKGDRFLIDERGSAGKVLDAATMVILELAFVTLWAGLVMGAIWADHSWGRPWGWDPKEVFALCTFVIFIILVHVRFKVRDKGLWTAILAVVGCAVMLFNWIVINFKISGLHSYA
ncbi:MAG TPA: cytochrome c biogenesis protein CcsA [Phycisphaerae bacterium]|nr:cytochrome c biogenesis protein CcsA [Phycisphaerae bacterium]